MKKRKPRKVNPAAKSLSNKKHRPRVMRNKKAEQKRRPPREQDFYMHGWTPGPWI